MFRSFLLGLFVALCVICTAAAQRDEPRFGMYDVAYDQDELLQPVKRAFAFHASRGKRGEGGKRSLRYGYVPSRGRRSMM